MLSDELRLLAEHIPKRSRIILHVGLKGFIKHGTVDYRLVTRDLVDSIKSILQPSDLFVPTFTYSFTKGGYFDVNYTRSEVGRFSEEVRKLYKDQNRRSCDPVFSVVNCSNSIDTTLNINAFGERSVWAELDRSQHFILNINLNSPIVATQLHYLEYKLNVPYRFSKFFSGQVIESNCRQNDVNYEYYVRNLDQNRKWDREKVAKFAIEKSACLKVGCIKAFNWNILSHELSKKIYADPEWLLQSKDIGG